MEHNAELKIRILCNDNQSREKGLMYADRLHDDEAAFFIFPNPGRYGFWNANVSFPLTLAFTDENGKILEFADLEAESKKPVEPKTAQVKYVIEVNKGLFSKIGVKVGDIIKYKNGALYI